MNPQDDPEARIRDLERSAAEYGAVELGTGQQHAGIPPTTQLPPPVNPYPNASPYGYSAPPFGVSYPQARKGAPVGLIFGLIAVVVVVIFGVIGVIFWNMNAATEAIKTRPGGGSSVAGGGGSIDERPSVLPTGIPPIVIPSIPGGSTDTEATPGGQLSIAGIDGNKTLACNEANINVSGVNNTIILTGHCLSVTVSGVDNAVTVDSADMIGASGFDNQVIYHSGAPEINAMGSNVVSQG